MDLWGGRNFEYYSEDPYLTSELATEFILGIQAEGVGGCLKHFAVNNQETRRMNIDVIVDEETLHENYLTAFEKPIKIGKPKMVMTAYNQVNGEFCASNKELLDTLRKEWGYKGVVVTDCFAAHDLAQGLKHGLTLQMPGESENRIVERITELLETGRLTEDDLNQAVRKNIAFALDAEINRKKRRNYDRESHHIFAQRVAEESMILLANRDNTLPLDKNERVLVVGELAVKPRFQGGGSSHVNPYNLEKPLEELNKIAKNIQFLMGYETQRKSEKEKLIDEVLEVADQFDKVVVFAGLPDLIESEGYDRESIKLPKEQNQLIAKLAAKHQGVIVVLANGSVVEMPWRNDVAAILESYLGGEAGGSAIANILYGNVNPSGKLAETFPICLMDNPTYLSFPGNEQEVVYSEGKFVGYKYYDALSKPVAFPFGHGLSYSSFSYQAQGKLIDEKRKVARLTIKNTSVVFGKEVVQIYVQRRDTRTGIFPKKLVGFLKIGLEPGESKEIRIPLDEKTFMSYHSEKHSWETDNGNYHFFIGSSVEDIRLEEECIIDYLPISISENSNIGDMVQHIGIYQILAEELKKHPKSLNFLEMTRDEDPLKAISMGSLMTFNTLKRVDDTLSDQDITAIINKLDGLTI